MNKVNIEELLNIGIALTSEKNHNRLLEKILTEARKITNADAGTLYLRNEDKLYFKIIQNETLGIFEGGTKGDVKLPPVDIDNNSVAGYVVLNRIVLNNIKKGVR